MWIRLLKLGARRPLTSLFVVVTLVAIAIVTPIALYARHDVDASAKPRQLIGRLWLDRMPDKARDEVDLVIFFGSGFGVYEHGSRYKSSIVFFEFERQGDKVDINFFQDGKSHKTKFTVSACNDDKNFDLCLDFENSPRGPKRYHSWGSDGEDAARIPWAADWKRATEVRAREER